MAATIRANVGDAAIMRRYYAKRLAPVPASRARADVLRLLEERKAIQRAGEALMMASFPYSGDPSLKQAIDEFRAILEGRPA